MTEANGQTPQQLEELTAHTLGRHTVVNVVGTGEVLMRVDKTAGGRLIGVRLPSRETYSVHILDTTTTRYADPQRVAAVAILGKLRRDLAGEDVHAGNAGRLAEFVAAGRISPAEALTSLRDMRSPQHIRHLIEQAAANIAASANLKPAAERPAPPQRPAPADDPITVKSLIGTTGARILITDQSEHAGGGLGQFRAARKRRPDNRILRVPGEPAGVHAATVTEVHPWSSGPQRYDVVTNLGTVEGVTAGQRFRRAPDDMEDSAVIRARLAAGRAQSETQQAYDRANPRDVAGVNVHPGDLVELLDLGGGRRPGRPYSVTRAIRAYGVCGLLVARPYERAYGNNPAGTSLALTFRRLADQGDGPTARRSCGCPAIIRDQIVPAPADGDMPAWRQALRHLDQLAAEDRQHIAGCRWADPEQRRAALPVAAPVAPKRIVPPMAAIDPADVRIERHRRSVTQGSVSVFYRDELINTFGDDIGPCKCADSVHDHGGATVIAGWHGRSDRYWVDVAARWVAERDAQNVPAASGWDDVLGGAQ